MKEDNQKKDSGASFKAVLVSAFIAAVPGMYSAWESAIVSAKARKNSLSVQMEKKVRDTQEKDLQDFVQVNKARIESLKESCVTHKDLFSYIQKLREEIDKKLERGTRPSSGRYSLFWKRKYQALKRKRKSPHKRTRRIKLNHPVLRTSKELRKLTKAKSP